MIVIDKEKRKIYMQHTPEEISEKRGWDETLHSFELLSGYVCPDCGLVLEANYVGELQYMDSEGKLHARDSEGEAQVHPYVPKRYTDYSSPTDPKYIYGHKYGGGCLILNNHESTSCTTYILGKTDYGDLLESLKYFIYPDDVDVQQLRVILEHIKQNNIPGVFLIEDICGHLPPRIAITKPTFCKHISYRTYTESKKDWEWRYLFRLLVKGDPEVKLDKPLPEITIAEVVPEVSTAPVTSPEPAYVPKAKPVMKTGKRNVYEMIYARLQEMKIIDENGTMKPDYMKFVCGGLMPLHVDNLLTDREGNQMLALAHNGKQKGDVMADPDMEVRVVHEMKMAEALSFRNDYLGINQVVYPEPGKVYPKLKTELNSFLNSWLKRMIEDQKYVLEFTETDGVETPAQVNEAVEPVSDCVDVPEPEVQQAPVIEVAEPEPILAPQVPKTCGECDMWNAFQKPATESTMGVCRNQDSKLFRKMLKKGNVCIMKEALQLEKQYDTVYLIKNIEGDFLGYDGAWIKELNNKSNPTKFYSDFNWIYNAGSRYTDVPDIVYCKARYDPVNDVLDNVERLSTDACLKLLGRI